LADWLGGGRINSLARGGLLLLGHGLRLDLLRLFWLRSSFLAFALLLWLSSTLVSLLALGHFHPMTWVTNLARPFSGLGRRKRSLSGRKLLRSRRGRGSIRPKAWSCLKSLSKVFWIIDVLDLPPLRVGRSPSCV